MKFGAAIVFLASLASSATAFAPSKASLRSTSALNIVAGDTAEEFAARVDAAFEAATPIDPEFEALVQDRFPGAIANQNLVTRSVNALQTKGYNGENTLLATSLCCDELARQLEDDYNKVFGNNFNLGGLAGFPFAGTTGFGAMAAHIPDDGYCLIVYGPHVGITAAGQVGKVERSGIKLVDTCCGSAVAAKGYVMDILNGEKAIDVGIQGFINFQQQGVQELILPHGKRLADAENDQIELPYALYDSQKVLIEEIISKGSTGIKRGLALLGGIQINTGPDTPDYFVPLQFDYMNYRGEVVADMLDSVTEYRRDDTQTDDTGTVENDTGQQKSDQEEASENKKEQQKSNQVETSENKKEQQNSNQEEASENKKEQKPTDRITETSNEREQNESDSDPKDTAEKTPQPSKTIPVTQVVLDKKEPIVASANTTPLSKESDGDLADKADEKVVLGKENDVEEETIKDKKKEEETKSAPKDTPSAPVAAAETPRAPVAAADTETISSAKEDKKESEEEIPPPTKETISSPKIEKKVDEEEKEPIPVVEESKPKPSAESDKDPKTIESSSPTAEAAMDEDHISWITAAAPTAEKETDPVAIAATAVDDDYLSFITGSATTDTEDNAKAEAPVEDSNLPLNDDHLSWITSPPEPAAPSGETSTVEDEDELAEVSETYLLGEQIASAFEVADIDIVGVDNEDSLVPALADSLLGSIEADEQTNSGWNQLGADSLYSIRAPSEDEDALTEDLLEDIAIHHPEDVEFSGDEEETNDEEITLVADSILNIICRDEGADFEEITEDEATATRIESPPSEAPEDDDDDDEPFTSHRFVLEPDNLLD